MLTIGMMFLSSFLSMNLFVCAEAGITFTAHIVRFHPPDPYCCNPPWQLKAVRGWFSVYRSQNVCQTFLTLHHSLEELHQPYSIFRTWFMLLIRPTDVCSGSVMWRKVPARFWSFQFFINQLGTQRRIWTICDTLVLPFLLVLLCVNSNGNILAAGSCQA